jgi:hypothetical protein
LPALRRMRWRSSPLMPFWMPAYGRLETGG